MLEEQYTLPTLAIELEECHINFFENIEKLHGKKIKSIKQKGIKLIIKFEDTPLPTIV